MNIIKHSVTVPHNAQVNIFDLRNTVNSQDIVEYVQQYRQQYPGSNTSNVVGWHTGYFAHKHTSNFNHLISVVENSVQTAINDSDFNVSVVQCWAAVYNKGDGAARHNHADGMYSAVYYAQAESDASPLKFDGGLIIAPETGMLVCFPSWLNHEVPASRSSTQRIVVAFNINYTLKSYEDRQ